MNDISPRNMEGSAPGGTASSQSSPPAFSEDGVDLTLIRWMLSLSPAERLAVLQAHAQAIVRLRNAPADA